MNEIDTNRRYTKYKRHTNESSERVNAQDINKIQEDLNTQQVDSNILKDTAFKERVYTIFQSNLYTNAMFIDIYENGQYIDKTSSHSYTLNSQLNNVSATKNKAVITSTRIQSVHGETIKLNDFFLITNEYIPVGASIKYYLKLSTGERYPINANVLKTPLHLSKHIQYGFSIVAELTRNSSGESPYINGYAVLYWDAQVEKNYGMTNPDLQRFPETVIEGDEEDNSNGDGITTIIRDRANEDKVVEVRTPTDNVKLIYDPENENKLAFVKTVTTEDNTTQLIKLGYKDYLNSENEIENVVTTVEQRTSDPEEAQQSKEYQALEEEIEILLNKKESY